MTEDIIVFSDGSIATSSTIEGPQGFAISSKVYVTGADFVERKAVSKEVIDELHKVDLTKATYDAEKDSIVVSGNKKLVVKLSKDNI